MSQAGKRRILCNYSHLMRRSIRKRNLNKFHNCRDSREEAIAAKRQLCDVGNFASEMHDGKWNEARDNVITIIESYNYFSRSLFISAVCSTKRQCVYAKLQLFNCTVVFGAVDNWGQSPRKSRQKHVFRLKISEFNLRYLNEGQQTK